MKLFFALFLLPFSLMIHAMDIDSKAAGLIAVAKINHMDITQFVLEKSPKSGCALFAYLST